MTIEDNNLPAVPSKWKVWFRIAKAGGLLSESISQRVAAHEFRMATVDAEKTWMVERSRGDAELMNKLKERHLSATDAEERLRLRSDMEYLERERRQVDVYRKAIDYVPDTTEAATEETEAPQAFRVWLDVFNDFARKANEEWRTDLLARALALEAQTPGIVGQRALWFIGTVDARSFDHFAALLNLCSQLGEPLIVPEFMSIAGQPLGYEWLGSDVALQNITFHLDGFGLFGNAASSSAHFHKGQNIIARYHDRTIVFHVNESFLTSGICLTPLGNALAKLYDRKPHVLGAEAFDRWLKQVTPHGRILLDTEKQAPGAEA